jgi:hypothetical protein
VDNITIRGAGENPELLEIEAISLTGAVRAIVQSRAKFTPHFYFEEN